MSAAALAPPLVAEVCSPSVATCVDRAARGWEGGPRKGPGRRPCCHTVGVASKTASLLAWGWAWRHSLPGGLADGSWQLAAGNEQRGPPCCSPLRGTDWQRWQCCGPGCGSRWLRPAGGGQEGGRHALTAVDQRGRGGCCAFVRAGSIILAAVRWPLPRNHELFACIAARRRAPEPGTRHAVYVTHHAVCPSSQQLCTSCSAAPPACMTVCQAQPSTHLGLGKGCLQLLLSGLAAARQLLQLDLQHLLALHHVADIPANPGQAQVNPRSIPPKTMCIAVALPYRTLNPTDAVFCGCRATQNAQADRPMAAVLRYATSLNHATTPRDSLCHVGRLPLQLPHQR